MSVFIPSTAVMLQLSFPSLIGLTYTDTYSHPSISCNSDTNMTPNPTDLGACAAQIPIVSRIIFITLITVLFYILVCLMLKNFENCLILN